MTPPVLSQDTPRTPDSTSEASVVREIVRAKKANDLRGSFLHFGYETRLTLSARQIDVLWKLLGEP